VEEEEERPPAEKGQETYVMMQPNFFQMVLFY
jgi:hypothetical protein